MRRFIMVLFVVCLVIIAFFTFRPQPRLTNVSMAPQSQVAMVAVNALLA